MPLIIREYFQGRNVDPAWTVTETGQTIFIDRMPSLADAERLGEFLSEREYLVTVMLCAAVEKRGAGRSKNVALREA